MSKMNEYPSVGDPQEFTQAEKAAFLGSAMCIATGPKNSATVTANIPFSEIRPTKLSDLTDDITQQTVVANDTRPVSGAAVSSAMASFGGFQVTTIDPNTHRPAVSGTIDPKAIYLTPSGESGTENAYDEWICTDTSVPTWEKVGVTRVDLSQYYTKSDTDNAFVKQNSMGTAMVYDSASGGVCLRYDAGLTLINDKLCVLCDNDTTFLNGSYVAVTNPVPPPGTNAHRGEVLTVNNSDEAVWAAPQGGLPTYDSTYAGRVLTVNQAGNGVEWTTPQGGGGNPYTKVSVTPGARYENGKTSEYYYNLLDQDVDIVNNTYSILSTPIGYEQSEYPNSENVDVFKIKLPANTEFPLAIVEFNIEHGHEHDGAVNDIKVYVGSTELTRIYDTPYNQNTVIADSDGDIWFSNASYPNGIKKSVSGDDWIMPAINDSNMIKTNTAFVTDWRNDTNVTCQVHIFGNCFSVKTSLSNSYPSGS